MRMFIYTLKLDRKKLAFIVVIAALLLVGIIMLAGALQKASAAAAAEAGGGAGSVRSVATVKNEKSRVAYLAQNGWEVESPAKSESKVMIPRTFSPVFEDYNALQKQQGFDLSRYCGSEVTMYTYRVTNAQEDGEVLAVLYVQDNKVVGGDVHSTALDGFMVGVRRDT